MVEVDHEDQSVSSCDFQTRSEPISRTRNRIRGHLRDGNGTLIGKVETPRLGHLRRRIIQLGQLVENSNRSVTLGGNENNDNDRVLEYEEFLQPIGFRIVPLKELNNKEETSRARARRIDHSKNQLNIA